jgi:hypothetical protein
LVAERTSVADTWRAKPPRGRDRLQAGNADAHDERLGGRHRAGSCHHHREGLAIFGGGIKHRLVAGQVRLAGEDIHRLRACDARHELHRQRLDPGRGVGIHAPPLAERIETRHQQRTGLLSAERLNRWPLNAQNDVGILQRRLAVAHARPRSRIVRIRYRRPRASARFHRHARAKTDELLHRLRRRSNPALARSKLSQYGYLHLFLPPAAVSQEMIRMTIAATIADEIVPHFTRPTKPA